MKIDVRLQEDPRLVLGIKGALDRHGARKLSRFLLHRDQRGFVDLELDLAAVDFIGLSAIATLHELCHSLSQRGGSLSLRNVSATLKGALDCLGKAPCWKVQNPDQQSLNKDPGG